jgi:hypothetical protein
MKKLSQIRKVYISSFHIHQVYEHLQNVGKKGLEGVALWTGTHQSNTEFLIQTTLIPLQKAYSSEDGLLYFVGEEELERINLWQYENKQTLIAQIHSHPTIAYHSETDDAYPIVARLGGISIVVPYFGFKGFSIEDWAVFRLFPEGWIELSNKETMNLIEIIV